MSTPPADPSIAFVGGGNMASAIITGLLVTTPPSAVLVCDPVDAVRDRHAAAGHVTAPDCAAAGAASLIVLAVKPQVVDSVLGALKPHLGPQHLVVSICAGITTARLASGLADGVRIARSMPNTPMAIGQGMVGLAPGPNATAGDMDQAEALFSGAATVLRCSEAEIDALTAISGSGPAYVFRFAECLLDAAKGLGFDDAAATLLVSRTLSGSIAYLDSQAGYPAGTLREQVTSPGGTTAAALEVMNNADLAGTLQRAVQAATKRAKELAG